MIKLLKRLFRRKMKALILIRPGEIREKGIEVLKAYAQDQGAGIITVMNPESVRVLTIGKNDRLLVPKSFSKEVLRRIAQSKPGDILVCEDRDVDKVHVLPGREVA